MNVLMLAVALATQATPVNLEDARARSRENVQALTAALQASSAEQDVRIARSSLLPQLRFQLGASVDYNGPQRFISVERDASGAFVRQVVDLEESLLPNFGLSLGVQQLIYDRAVWARLEQSGAQLEAQQGEALEQQDTSELEGINRFYSLFRTQATIQVLEANVRRSEQQLERARALFQAGRVGKAEELSAQVNLGNDRIAVVARQSQLATDQARLSTWLAMPGAEAVEAVDPGVLAQSPAPAPALEQALQEARTRRPLLVALRKRLRAAELQESIANAGYLPRVSLQGSYSRNGPNADIVFGNPRLQNSVSGGVTVSWDLFNGFTTQAQARRAQYQSRVAELNLQQSERELEGTVRQSHVALAAQITSAELAEANRKAAADALVLAEERFNAGVSSTLEVRDAQLKLTQAELTLLENRINVEIARFTLMRAMGTLAPGEAK
ncbi:outer membrane protein TolC [Archangium gephyra]|uniref:Cobalt-zinc-cadmium resistance protein CzcA n=1 Tax=Archangium gephyra TaxID=48 RepID=A0AAC8THG4_9BACT|nr:TolC family protein [Archangium gephyra]AKJ04516.1 Cobalt-zinc-cadmium resistance protein CzcA [Archangium gephyra]REG37414.1 outer membrane protein TolC [Archangium gephyra]